MFVAYLGRTNEKPLISGDLKVLTNQLLSKA